MNRRGNGLTADSYAPLIDLAPHLADAMLTELRQAGVAAYAAPLPDPAGPEPSGDPLDRLYVDTAMKATAEGILETHLTRLHDVGPWSSDGSDPEPRPSEAGATSTAERDDDAIWAEIVAGYDTAPEDGATPWPEQENLDEPDDAPDDAPGDRTGRLPTVRVIKPVDEDQDDEDEDEPLEPDDEGHYVPPPPPPLPSGDPVSRAAWAALVGGPLYLLLTVVLGWSVPGWAAFLAVAAFIGGFVTLVLRMGDDPRDTDDGAIV
ncbi:hypothetical protein DPM19_21665 [Actinomadura craniellae]|uniref:DUF308 domain-containing protein n=1 Tax=Actinomadura craniellae TaxID=2231787 RepID=A0A365H1X0_9ACTN|nr:hypothetical protein [Actinomadura craniellae]RAY13104.1 hypothetical protein DPM19_21665 [Actinomadura craniellae]